MFRVCSCLCLAALFAVASGCGGDAAPPSAAVKPQLEPLASGQRPRPTEPGHQAAAGTRPVRVQPEVAAGPAASPSESDRPKTSWEEIAALPAIDSAKLRNLDIRRIDGDRLTLFTDLEAHESIDALPGVFEQAISQWCEYFGVDPAELAGWRMNGYLMGDRQRFRQAGLLPDDLPRFEHGYCRGRELWVMEQPSPYYRRHLLLHEGTHGWMNSVLGGCGPPPWYMEGMAELLATHRMQNGRVQLRTFPSRREEVPMWGRIGIVQRASAEGRMLPLANVLAFDQTAHLQPEPYAWCWTLAVLLDTHPHYQQRFRSLAENIQERNFTARFLELFAEDLPALEHQWQAFAGSLRYGHDIARSAVTFQQGMALDGASRTVTVHADRGWQSSGVWLEQGDAYRIDARGRYQVADRPQPWWCEPGGVTVHYHEGMPLGMLVAAMVSPQPLAGEQTPLLSPLKIGTGRVFRPDRSGTLYLKINESPATLSDNAGTLAVEIRREPSGEGPVR